MASEFARIMTEALVYCSRYQARFITNGQDPHTPLERRRDGRIELWCLACDAPSPCRSRATQ